LGRPYHKRHPHTASTDTPLRGDNLVKKVMETAQCDEETAQSALLDCGDDLNAAVIQAVQLNESNQWTEKMNRKTQKLMIKVSHVQTYLNSNYTFNRFYPNLVE
jgi:N-acetylmuramic acid 6-phosphate (MurNAc-6-P) etherase